MKTSNCFCFILLVGTLWISVNCSNNKSGNSTIKKEQNTAEDSIELKRSAFEKFFKKFKPLQLPLTIRTLDDQPSDSSLRITGTDSIFIHSGYPEETWAYGSLPDTTSNFQLIWLAPAEISVPVLTVFSKTGQKISEKYLGVGHCGSDCCFSCSETIIINKDLTIYSVDSIRSCTCDSAGPILSTMINSIQFMKGNISRSGQIYMSAIVVSKW